MLRRNASCCNASCATSDDAVGIRLARHICQGATTPNEAVPLNRACHGIRNPAKRPANQRTGQNPTSCASPHIHNRMFHRLGWHHAAVRVYAARHYAAYHRSHGSSQYSTTQHSTPRRKTAQHTSHCATSWRATPHHATPQHNTTQRITANSAHASYRLRSAAGNTKCMFSLTVST